MSKSNDSFDIDEEWTGPKKSSPAAAPRDLLTGDKVAAVKFNVGKPGYSFGQVEAFVRQVEEALRWYEEQKHRHAVELHEAKDDRLDLEEKIATLQATIEVFRANGDPLVDQSGNYVTQSQVSNAPVVDTTAIDALQAEVLRLTTALQAAESQVVSMRQEVEAANAATREAETAELELREYINETLLPWIEAASAAAQEGGVIQQQVETPAPVVPVVSTPEPVVDSSEWEDAPSIGGPSAPVLVESETEEVYGDPSDEDEYSQPAVTPLLVNAPELAGQQVDLSQVPVEEESGRKKGKKKGSLANAPEVNG